MYCHGNTQQTHKNFIVYVVLDIRQVAVKRVAMATRSAEGSSVQVAGDGTAILAWELFWQKCKNEF